jgi:uncharacterized protein
MKYLKLGKTDLEISEVGFGCIPIIRLTVDDAVNVLKYAYDNGITFFDTANAYRDSEKKIGNALSKFRDKIVIATKSIKRDAVTLNEHLENSLRMMKTDYIDLYQLHQVAHEHEWEKIIGPGGALEAAQKALKEGKIRHLGVTSHNQAMAVKLIKTGLFKTVQFPFNFIEPADKSELYRLACKMKLGIIAMKPFAGGVIDDGNLAFRYLRQFPEITPIPGFESLKQVDEIVGIYKKPNAITKKDFESINRYRKELGNRFCRRCEYCQPCPNEVMITAAMGYPILAKRMSEAVAVDFLQKAMESVKNCKECGECLKKCPYKLSIPETLKKHYDIYEKHLAAR